MRVRRLEVENFRGIRWLDWRSVGDTCALVGPGDSCKTTILDALERVLSPRWNLAFDDTDFWNLDSEQPIRIAATITDLPRPFLKDTKFGHALVSIDHDGGASAPDGSENEELALVVELRVDSSLEPIWSVVDGQGAEHPIHVRDREALGMLRVGGYVDGQLGWSRGSVLTRLTESGDGVGALLADASRKARAGLKPTGLVKLDEAASKVEAVGRRVGVSPTNSYKPNLDSGAISFGTGALSLHDGEVPVRRAGLGTRRLLAIAMQRDAAARHGISLVDEFEHGLEPHRVRRLLRVLRGKPPEPEAIGGQLILTTHSPTVLSELDGEEVFVTRRKADGTIEVLNLPAPLGVILGRAPEALVARRVIVGEGITEVGLCLGLDAAWERAGSVSFAYRGVAVVDGGGGTSPAEIAGALDTLGYEAGLVVDSDAKAKVSRAKKAKLFQWPGKVATEERIALDLPRAGLVEMVGLASRARAGIRSVRDSLAQALGTKPQTLGMDTNVWLDAVPDEAAFRKAFGEQAKKSDWFKSLEMGTALGELVAKYERGLTSTGLATVVQSLKAFAHHE